MNPTTSKNEELIEQTRRILTEDPGADTAGAATGACCGPARQAVCCEPSEKSVCCGPEKTAGGGCGCT